MSNLSKISEKKSFFKSSKYYISIVAFEKLQFFEINLATLQYCMNEMKEVFY